MTDDAKVIYFHIKRRDVQGLVFVQITIEKFTTKFYFEDEKVGRNVTSVEDFCMFTRFYASTFSIKTFFILSTRRFFHKTDSCFWKFNKNRSHLTFLII